MLLVLLVELVEVVYYCYCSTSSCFFVPGSPASAKVVLVALFVVGVLVTRFSKY